MLPGGNGAVETGERQSSATEAQPLPAPAPLTEASDELEKPQPGLQMPVCHRCGLPDPQNGFSSATPTQSSPHGSERSGHKGSGRSRSKASGAGAHQSAPTPTGSCFQLLLACLWCRFSAVLLGLLEACSCCLQGLCSSCCRGCARCCSALQDAPGEELGCPAHCRSLVFQSCCEPLECLEFCLDCCEICHRS